jgi:SpoVK/Ycf46/Vps4 family AAA+-type ATPase
MVGDLVDRYRRKRIQTSIGLHEEVEPCEWSDLVLAPDTTAPVRDDFQSFLLREKWFRERKLPFRRGYLFHGPPGNGKSSVIRAMLCSSEWSAISINLASAGFDDDQLEMMFAAASTSAPTVIVLEDLDRAFGSPRVGGSLSIQSLLSCLDGINKRNGVVVIATANDLRNLDPALIRTGRFDRLVYFGRPTPELRTEYFRNRLPTSTDEDLFHITRASDGFSFAELNESLILAGQPAFNSQSDLTTADVICAANQLKLDRNGAHRFIDSVGFSERSHVETPK